MAALDWSHLLTPQRAAPGSRSTRDERSEFERDYDRVIYASPFRRLQDKAQVFPLEHNDFVRTRLTHSLEVSTLGRSLGRQVARRLVRDRGLEVSSDDFGTIVATTCLAHDIGNPPFGHSGEEAIRRYFRSHGELLNDLTEKERADLLHFDGNAQGLRILLFLHSLRHAHGLNLTYPTLASFMKYVTGADELEPQRKFRRKPGYFQSEASMVETFRSALGLHKARHPLAFLMEAADDIAYSVVDLEDGLRKQVLRTEVLSDHLEQALRGTRFMPLVERFKSGCRPQPSESLDEAAQQALQWFRIGAIGEMFASIVDAFLSHYEEIMEGSLERPLMALTGECQLLWQALIQVATDHVYCANEVLALELFGDRVIQDLLSRFVPACLAECRDDTRTLEGKHFALISPSIRALQTRATPMRPYDRIQVAVDYVCGMTDTFAVGMYEKLNGRMP